MMAQENHGGDYSQEKENQEENVIDGKRCTPSTTEPNKAIV